MDLCRGTEAQSVESGAPPQESANSWRQSMVYSGKVYIHTLTEAATEAHKTSMHSQISSVSLLPPGLVNSGGDEKRRLTT